jgi:hypothetical protein
MNTTRVLGARYAGLLATFAIVVMGCGSADTSGGQSGTTPAQTPAAGASTRQDLASIERQVNRQVTDQYQGEAVDQGTFASADTTCTQQSDTAYKCLTTVTSPPGVPTVLTDVTCDRNGGDCITESRP